MNPAPTGYSRIDNLQRANILRYMCLYIEIIEKTIKVGAG